MEGFPEVYLRPMHGTLTVSVSSVCHSFHIKPSKMLLQSSLHSQTVSLSSSLFYSQPLSCQSMPSFWVQQNLSFQRFSFSCSVSKIHSYGTVDYERRPIVRWNAIYKRISLMENPELGSASVLNQWENEGNGLTKWDLCRVVKELRKFKRYERALEVYDWMNNREERFRISASDAAIQLDLIAKVRGVSSAEKYFLRLTNDLKEMRAYGALLNVYVRARMKEKAESLLDTMKNKGYATHSLPFNVMMTLYMNLKDYDKVELMVSEMMERNIQLDIYSYNIWLSSCGSQESTEKMEQVYERMAEDKTIVPNWTTFSTMAAMYIKMDMLEKAEECLRKVESRIRGRDRIPYHYLLSLYGNVGKKGEVYRVWNTYKSIFPSIPNLGYHAIISSMVRQGEIEDAEKLYEEWVSVKSNYDPRIANLLIGWYVKEGNIKKARDYFNHMIEHGGKPNSNTWEILADGHIGDKKISDTLSCLKEAFVAPGSKSWRPKPVTLSAFINLCQDRGDMASNEVLIGLLRQSGLLKDQDYASVICLLDAASGNSRLFSKVDLADRTDDINDVENTDDSSQMLLNQLEGTL